jgi:hypothetical protein
VPLQLPAAAEGLGTENRGFRSDKGNCQRMQDVSPTPGLDRYQEQNTTKLETKTLNPV